MPFLLGFPVASESDEQLFVMYSIGTELYKKKCDFPLKWSEINRHVLIQIVLETLSIYIFSPPVQGVFEVPCHGGSLVCRRRKRSG